MCFRGTREMRELNPGLLHAWRMSYLLYYIFPETILDRLELRVSQLLAEF